METLQKKHFKFQCLLLWCTVGGASHLRVTNVQVWREIDRDRFLQEGPQLLEEGTCGQEEGGCDSNAMSRETFLAIV